MKRKKALPYHAGREFSLFRRASQKLKIRRSILVICEGSATESQYFDNFRSAKVISVNAQRKIFVERAIERKAKLESERGAAYDSTWCVFDVDGGNDGEITQTVALAKKHGIKVACSNRSFEVWVLLHFQLSSCGPTHSNRELIGKLNKIFRKKFRKDYDKSSSDLYDDLKPYQPTAIANARQMNRNNGGYRPTNDPATNVFDLVLELNSNLPSL